MFDYHMHSTVSFDGKGTPEEMVKMAKNAGLKEICFTDHIDYEANAAEQIMVFDLDRYSASYDHLCDPDVKIRRGVEFGLKPHNQEEAKRDLKRRHYDFVLGSIHLVDEVDIYFRPFWEGKTTRQAFQRYLEETLASVRGHEDYDVLGHLTYAAKCPENREKLPIRYGEYREIVDEILKILVRKGKGLEINTSGVDRCGDYLPGAEYVRRFKELGGEIVTVGSDAHTPDRVGQYTHRACDMLRDIFGYVCTFEDRKPIFHKL